MKRLLYLLLLVLAATSVFGQGSPPAPDRWKKTGTVLSPRGTPTEVRIRVIGDSVVFYGLGSGYIDPTMLLNDFRVLDGNIVESDTLYVKAAGYLYVGGNYITDFVTTTDNGLKISGSGVVGTILGDSVSGGEVNRYTLQKVNFDSTQTVTWAAIYLASGGAGDSLNRVMNKKYIDTTLAGLHIENSPTLNYVLKRTATGASWQADVGAASGDNVVVIDSNGTTRDMSPAVFMALDASMKLGVSAGLDTVYLRSAGGAGGIDTTHFLNITVGDTVAGTRTFNWGAARFDSLGSLDVDSIRVDRTISFSGGSVYSMADVAGIKSAAGGSGGTALVLYGLNAAGGNASTITFNYSTDSTITLQIGANPWRFRHDTMTYLDGITPHRGKIFGTFMSTDSATIAGQLLNDDDDIVSVAELPDLMAFSQAGATRDSFVYKNASGTAVGFLSYRSSVFSIGSMAGYTLNLVGGSSGSINLGGNNIDSAGAIHADRIKVDSFAYLGAFNAPQTRGINMRAPVATYTTNQLILPIPSTGSDGYVLAKTATVNGDSTYWIAQSGGGGGGNPIYIDNGSTITVADSIAFKGTGGIVVTLAQKTGVDTATIAATGLTESNFATDAGIATEAEVGDTATAITARLPWAFKGTGNGKDTTYWSGITANEVMMYRRAGTIADSFMLRPSSASDVLVLGGSPGLIKLDTAAIAQMYYKAVVTADSALVTVGAMTASSVGTKDSAAVNVGGSTRIYPINRVIVWDDGIGTALVRTAVNGTTDSINIDLNYDNSTIGINGSDQLYVKAGGIATGQILDGTILAADLNATMGSAVTINWAQSSFGNLDSLGADTVHTQFLRMAKQGTIEADSGSIRQLDSLGFTNVAVKVKINLGTSGGHIKGVGNVYSGGDGMNFIVDTTQAQAVAEGFTFGLQSHSATWGDPSLWYFYGINPTSALDSFAFRMYCDTLFASPTRKGYLKNFKGAYIDTLHGKADSAKMADSAKTVRANVLDSTNLKDASIPLVKIHQSGATLGQFSKWDGSDWVPADVSIGADPTFYGDVTFFGYPRVQNVSSQWDLNKAVAMYADTFLTIHVGDTIKDICIGEDTTSAVYSQYSWVHLGGVYIPNGWNGYNRWMAGTPYTCGPASELPVMRVSNDGITWIAVPGAAKLIAFKTECDTAHGDTANYLSDIELVIGADGKQWVYWRSTDYIDSIFTDGWNYTVASSIWCKSTTNGTTWSTARMVVPWDTAGSITINQSGLSPAVWLDSNSTYKMMFVSNTTTALCLWQAPQPDSGWAFVDSVKKEGTSDYLGLSNSGIFDSLPTGAAFWHLEVIPVAGDEKILLLTAKNPTVDVTCPFQTFIGRTRDNGVSVYLRAKCIFPENYNMDTIKTTSPWDAGGQYRGTGWVADRGYGKEIEYIYVGYNAKIGASPGFKPGRTFIRFDKDYETVDLNLVASKQRWARTDSLYLTLDVTDSLTQDTAYLLENYTAQGSDADTFSVYGFVSDTFQVDSVIISYSTSNGTTTNVKIDSVAFKKNGAQGDQWGTMVSNVWCGSGTDRANTSLTRLALPWRFTMLTPGDRAAIKFFTNLSQDDSWLRIEKVQLYGYKL